LASRGAPPPFLCGGIGYFSYDLRTQIEKLPSRAKDDLQVPDIYFAFYDTVLHYDNKENLARFSPLISNEFCRRRKGKSRVIRRGTY